jgi:putative transposase
MIHDRDAKFPRAFAALLANDGVNVIRKSVRAPNANAHMERWAGTVGRESLDRLLILRRRELRTLSASTSRITSDSCRIERSPPISF